MAKSADAFRTISEVAEWLETPAHVLRFWESKFSQVKPVKRAGGRRYYRPADMMLLGGIKKLLHDDGMTIKGVQKILREQGIKHISQLSQPLDEMTEAEVSDMAIDVEPEDTAPDTAEVVNLRGASRSEPVPPPPPDKEHEDTGATAANDDAEQVAETEAEADPDTLPDAAAMPSFLRRPLTPQPTPDSDAAEDDEDQPQDAPPAPAAPALANPDIPDDPDDDIEAQSGALTALGALHGVIDPQAAALLADLAEQLGPGTPSLAEP